MKTLSSWLTFLVVSTYVTLSVAGSYKLLTFLGLYFFVSALISLAVPIMLPILAIIIWNYLGAWNVVK